MARCFPVATRHVSLSARSQKSGWPLTPVALKWRT